MNCALLWDDLNETHPLAAKLALLSCLSIRVTPAQLRLARLRLLPHSGTGDEGDLWLSDLVEARSAAGFSYRREVRNDLRARLCGEPGLLDEVWRRIHLEQAHWLAPRVRLEDELTWRLLRDHSDPVIETLWASVVGELDEGPNPEGVARWVVRAVPDLPPGALDHHSGQCAYFGAYLLLGDASVLGSEAQRFLETSELAFATRRLPRRRIFVGLSEGSLILSPLREIENGNPIDIPATRPLWLQLEYGSPSMLNEVVTIVDTEPRHHALPTPKVTLRSLDGAAYLLAPATEGPLIFISYASQNADAARAIADQLLALGAGDVWLDRKKLRGGDDWSRKLDEAIYSCDYFLPLLSSEADERREGVFWEEWVTALEREKRIADTFLLPTLIDATPESFNSYQRIGKQLGTQRFWALHLLNAPGGVLDDNASANLAEVFGRFRKD